MRLISTPLREGYFCLIRIFTLFILLLNFSPALSQPQIKAIFTPSPPVIDGFVNDEVWNNAALINELYQREPRPGEPVSEKTEFYFLYDNNNIYVGIRCFDDPAEITAKELARDVGLGDDDRVQVIFDTYLDGRNGYWFQIGPRGSIGDALISENGKDFNKSWDGLWDGKARIHDSGWDAELIIPFKTLGFKKGTDTWGLKLIRHIKRNSESSYWPETSLNADRFGVSDAGRITGLENITQGIGLDIIPYATGGISKKQFSGPDAVLDGGLDAFYQITPSIKTAVTINTDFAQTEVDEKQINLTRFNLYFPEKRDFFLDGVNYFTFGINGDSENHKGNQMIPFFSRRMGLDSEGNPVAIKYGGKFTGKTGKLNFGLLHIKDNNNWNNPGYSVGRISRNMGKQSSIGIIGTHGNALADVGNSLAGIDLRLATSEFSGNKNIIYNFYAAKTFTKELSGRDNSFGTELNFPNDLINFRVGYLQIGENFVPGLGFVPRRDIRDFYGSFTVGPRPANSRILQIKSGFRYDIISELKTGDLQTAQIDLNYANINFISGDVISLSSQYQFDAVTMNFNIFDTIIVPADEYHFWHHTLQLTSARRRNLWASTRVGFGTFYSGNRTDLLIQAGYKIGVPLFIGLESDRRWVNLNEGNFVAQIYRLNLNLLFTPNLSWYNFAQYENKTKTIGWQSRIQWIIKPGKAIYLTYNSPLIDPFERFRPEIYEARVKVKYTIRF